MKTAIVLFQQELLDKYPYLQYIYNAMIAHYSKIGVCYQVYYQEASFQKLANNKDSTALLLIELPAKASIKSRLWEKINYPALIKQLSPSVIYGLVEQLPAKKNGDLEKRWVFVSDIQKLKAPAEAKGAALKKHTQYLSTIMEADLLIVGNPAAAASLQELASDFKDKTTLWLPMPTTEYLDEALYSEELLDRFKEEHTKGHPYFILDARTASELDLISYLKAFSQFKKWQRSSMGLALLLSEAQKADASFNEKLDTYYYKQDVYLLAGLEQAALYQWLKGAYALVTPLERDLGLDLQLAGAALGVLLIAPSAPGIDRLLPKARFDLAGLDQQTISQVLIASYKTELLRTRHIQAGLEAFQQIQGATMPALI